MNIPESVKIGWRNYMICQGEHRAADNGGDLLGEIVYESNIIYLYQELAQDEKAVTLLHEIVHGILYHMGNENVSNEPFVTAFAENLYGVIKENPQLFGGKF